MVQGCSVGWLLFPGASSKRGKAYSSTRASGNKTSLESVLPGSSWTVPFSPASRYLSGRSRDPANKTWSWSTWQNHSKYEKDTCKCGEARGSAVDMEPLCTEWHSDSSVKTLLFFWLSQTGSRLASCLLEWVYSKSITGHWIQSLPSNSEVGPLLMKSCRDYLRVHTCLFKGEEQHACVKHQRQKEMGHVGISGLLTSRNRNYQWPVGSFLSCLLLLTCLFTWLCCILVVACGIFVASFGIFHCASQASSSWGMWDLSSLTRDRTHVSCIGRLILNHWTIREVPW